MLMTKSSGHRVFQQAGYQLGLAQEDAKNDKQPTMHPLKKK